MNELLEEIADLKVRRRFNLENSLSAGDTNTLVVNIHVFVLISKYLSVNLFK